MNKKWGKPNVLKAINDLIGEEKPTLPEFMRDMVMTASVMSVLFNGLKLGEISNNLVFQANRLAKTFEIELKYDREEVKEIAQHFIDIIQNKVKVSQEEALKNANQKTPTK